jgi:hypothetical protein
MTIRNIILVIKDQMSLKRFLMNLFRGNLMGIIHKRSHLTFDDKPKVAYGSKASAEKAAAKMSLKRGVHFSCYKCLHCNGYHIGKNLQSRKELEEKTHKDGNSK